MKELLKELNDLIEQLDIDINDFYIIDIQLGRVYLQGYEADNELLIARLKGLEGVRETNLCFFPRNFYYKNVKFGFVGETKNIEYENKKKQHENKKQTIARSENQSSP